MAKKYLPYIEYLSKYNYITDHVNGRIHEYLRDDTKKVKAKISIEKHLGTYKQLRDWYFGTKAFIAGEKRINGKLGADEYPTQYGEVYHQCTIEETVKSLNLTK